MAPPIEPEVVYPVGGSAPAGRHPEGTTPSMLPSFPAMAGFVDRWAKRIPWWSWVGLTLIAVWWQGRRKGRRRIVEEG